MRDDCTAKSCLAAINSEFNDAIDTLCEAASEGSDGHKFVQAQASIAEVRFCVIPHLVALLSNVAQCITTLQLHH